MNKLGRPPENGVGRARLRKTWVSHETALIIESWRRTFGLPTGRCIDAAIQYVKDREDFRIPKSGVRPSLKQYH
jgi:hypothetical protein